MQRFNFIKKHNSEENYVNMYDFWKSIQKTSANKKNIYSPFKNQVELLYISLLVGLKLEIKDDISKYELVDINDNWTDELKNSKASDYIIGLYLNKITKKFAENKADINKKLNEVLDNNSNTKLSANGLKELHEYAFGGYNEILKAHDYKVPDTLVDFFLKTYSLLNS
ncbi:MAG: hypothetical protein ISQ17_00655 [Pelagibacteraceae bacterium]|nr:hypothetical protein [Pelagibacteraceae bacterium]